VGGSGSFRGGSSGSGFGGAVFARNATLTAVFNTFSGDSARDGRTDIYVLSDGPGNQATATLIKNILGQNTTSASDFLANAINGGSSPILDGSSHDLVRQNPPSGGLPAGAVVSSADARLGPLASNGGPTQTMALQAGSPAILAGVPSGTVFVDQRGRLRNNPPDLGAFQLTQVSLSAPSTPSLDPWLAHFLSIPVTPAASGPSEASTPTPADLPQTDPVATPNMLTKLLLDGGSDQDTGPDNPSPLGPQNQEEELSRGALPALDALFASWPPQGWDDADLPSQLLLDPQAVDAAE
jgi:hypothetical protein